MARAFLVLALAWSALLLPAWPDAAPAAAAEDTYRQLDMFGDVYEHVVSDFVEERSPAFLLTAAIEGMIAEVPDNPGVAAAREAADRASQADTSDNQYDGLSAFGDAFEALRSGNDGDAALIKAAIANMMRTLDPHSRFISTEALSEMRTNNSGEFGGLGIEVTIEDDFVRIVAPIDGSPATRAGLRAGDFIVAIDGASIQGMDLPDAVALMRGRVGSPVKLTVRRERPDESRFDLDMTVVRDTIRINPVSHEARGSVGYVRITAFNQQAGDRFADAVDALKSDIGDGLAGLVIDLRNNPGGLLEQVGRVTDALLEEGEIYSVRARSSDHSYETDATAGTIVGDLPIAILINQGTSSGSEILAAAMQDHERATIIGETSFGMGSVQTIIPVKDDAALRLTTGYYHRPGGGRIGGYGIVPDIVVETGAGGDPQLDAALSLIEDPEGFAARRHETATASTQPTANTPPPAATQTTSAIADIPRELGTRVALVIGNSDYRHTAALRNPANDASDVADALESLGFSVIQHRDLTKQGMDNAFREFAREARGADAALFYYAGHAMQFEGVNYLMPVDAQLADEVDIPYEMAQVDDIVADMSRTPGVRIAILDSCRDNPLEAQLKGNLARTRAIGQTRGLTRIARPEGLIVAYATQAGNIADDGGGRNSPFTGALLEHIATPNLEIGPMFRRVMRSVKTVTGGSQHPELSVLFDGEFYFNPEG